MWAGVSTGIFASFCSSFFLPTGRYTSFSFCLSHAHNNLHYLLFILLIALACQVMFFLFGQSINSSSHNFTRPQARLSPTQLHPTCQAASFLPRRYLTNHSVSRMSLLFREHIVVAPAPRLLLVCLDRDRLELFAVLPDSDEYFNKRP